MPPTIQTKAATYTVKDLLHTLPGGTGPGTTTPFTGRRVHFVGIGGTGMSGLAQMLMDLGAQVSGTDRTPSAVTRRLSQSGASVSYTESAETLPQEVDIVVHSAAIKPEHPELVAAHARVNGNGSAHGCEILKYAQMLGRVMKLKHGIAIAGTHGKSTTTAMTAHILLCAGKDPSFVVGATSPQLGGSSRSGSGDFFVVEACEFDRSFHQLRPKIGAVLNIEEDHLDYYSGIDEITESFATFLNQVDPAGVAIISASDANCATAARNAQATVETYGIDIPADWQAAGVRRFQGKAHFNVTYKGKKIGRLTLSIAGRHNVGNALVAAAIATHCGVPWEQIQPAIESFRGADRRSQLLGQFPWPSERVPCPAGKAPWGPAGHAGALDTPAEAGLVTIVDDYGHHPTEIRATLLALREHYRPKRLLCVFQPHQHSRTRFLLDDFARSFAHADVTIVPDIYFVRDSEEDRRSVNSAMLVERIKGPGGSGRDAVYLPTFAQITDHLMRHMQPGDLVVSMGAGPVWEVTDELVRRIRGSGPA